MVLERILLQTIKFDLQVEHPYQFLLKYAKQLKGKKKSYYKTFVIVKSSLCNSLMTLNYASRKRELESFTREFSAQPWLARIGQYGGCRRCFFVCKQILSSSCPVMWAGK